jgi:hypothetical protein
MSALAAATTQFGNGTNPEVYYALVVPWPMTTLGMITTDIISDRG